MSETVIKVENLSKLYQLGEVGTGTISHDLNRFFAKIRGKEDPYQKVGQLNDRTKQLNNSTDKRSLFAATNNEHVWALKDINFEVKQGEVLGIIGKNGAGKSTLLKLLSRVTAPTTGSIKIRGRVASLLEVGTGFHPEMTGRENIFMNGTILGMTRKEIQSKLEEIVEFAGIAKYLDTPTKRYSSGMSVRLAFAVAAFLEPEILIVDEVLAVGDAEFQKRAIGKMQDISKGEGRTVLFVSHNMSTIRAICNEGLVLNNGEELFSGAIDDSISSYLKKSMSSSVELKSNGLVLSEFKLTESQFEDQLFSGSPVQINGKVIGNCLDETPYLIFNINNSNQINSILLSSRLSQVVIKPFKDLLEFTLNIERLNLVAGVYTIDVNLISLAGTRIASWKNALEFSVEVPKEFGNISLPSIQLRGISHVNSKWTVQTN